MFDRFAICLNQFRHSNIRTAEIDASGVSLGHPVQAGKQRMKNTTVWAVLLLLLFLPAAAWSQHPTAKKGDKKTDAPENNIWEQCWWGVGPNIGFSSVNGASSFGLGVSGQLGYKFTPALSVGPRINFFYSSVKYSGFKNLNLFDTEAGAFLRGKVWRGIFLQGDLSNSWTQVPGEALPDRTISKISYQRFNQWIGGGWNTGNGQVGSEISYHYNLAVASDINAIEQPWELRFMITWRF